MSRARAHKNSPPPSLSSKKCTGMSSVKFIRADVRRARANISPPWFDPSTISAPRNDWAEIPTLRSLVTRYFIYNWNFLL